MSKGSKTLLIMRKTFTKQDRKNIHYEDKIITSLLIT